MFVVLSFQVVRRYLSRFLGVSLVDLNLKHPIDTFTGYLNSPDATEQIIDGDRWLHTGDIGHYDKDQQLYIVDKENEVIKYKSYQASFQDLFLLMFGQGKITFLR